MVAAVANLNLSVRTSRCRTGGVRLVAGHAQPHRGRLFARPAERRYEDRGPLATRTRRRRHRLRRVRSSFSGAARTCVLLLFGAIIGVPVAAAAYFFLEGFTEAQQYLYDTLPGDLGFDSQPVWWSVPLLALSGLLVALTIRYLPGTAGHKPAEGFKASGPVPPIELPGDRYRGVRLAQPRGRPWPGGASDRDRQWSRSPRRPLGQARRA